MTASNLAEIKPVTALVHLQHYYYYINFICWGEYLDEKWSIGEMDIITQQ
jgi:hypothetical protein